MARAASRSIPSSVPEFLTKGHCVKYALRVSSIIQNSAGTFPAQQARPPGASFETSYLPSQFIVVVVHLKIQRRRQDRRKSPPAPATRLASSASAFSARSVCCFSAISRSATFRRRMSRSAVRMMHRLRFGCELVVGCCCCHDCSSTFDMAASSRSRSSASPCFSCVCVAYAPQSSVQFTRIFPCHRIRSAAGSVPGWRQVGGGRSSPLSGVIIGVDSRIARLFRREHCQTALFVMLELHGGRPLPGVAASADPFSSSVFSCSLRISCASWPSADGFASVQAVNLCRQCCSRSMDRRLAAPIIVAALFQ